MLLVFSYIYVDFHVPVNDALTAICFFIFSTYTPGGVMKSCMLVFSVE